MDDHHSYDIGRDHQLKLAEHSTWDVIKQLFKCKLLISPKLFFKCMNNFRKRNNIQPQAQNGGDAKNLLNEKPANIATYNVQTLEE